MSKEQLNEVEVIKTDKEEDTVDVQNIKGGFSLEYSKGKLIEEETLKYFKDSLGVKITDLSEDEEYQKKDIDFKGDDDYYEIKGDFTEVYEPETPLSPGELPVNIFFETNPNSTGSYCGKAWTQICEADYLLYNFVNYNKCLKIDWAKFKASVLHELGSGNFFRMKHNRSFDINGQMVMTYGLVINYKFFKDFIVDEFDINFTDAIKPPESRDMEF